MNSQHRYEKDAIIRRMQKRRADSAGQLDKEHRSVGIMLYVFVSIAALLFLFLMVAVFTG